MTAVTVELPEKLVWLFDGDARYRVAYGGRGSGKTRGFAKMAAIKAYQFDQMGLSGQILCAREHLNSLDESSMEEVKAAIRDEGWLEGHFDVGESFIRTKSGNITFAFSGLRRNVDSIKSKARILLCWIDEAEHVSDTAWMKLVPTVREDGSEIWVSYNPESKRSATHKRFREQTPDDCRIVEINYRDNPWFPLVLERERLEDKEKRPEIYGHIWEGEFLEHAEGAYYLHELRACKEQGRIKRVPYEKRVPVVTAWDLGVGDSTAIWCAQFVANEVHVIDYYEADGVGLDHYVRWLQNTGYIYGEHILPHDVRVRELGTGKSRLETLQELGMRPITIAPQIGVDDGIQSVRNFLDTCWFDAEKCDEGLNALRQYRRDYSEQRESYNNRPLHNWASHGADAFRYLAIGARINQRSSWKKPIKRNLKVTA